MIHKEFEKFSKSLNPAQLEAVLHEQGPAVVFAGAGSGKTRVISLRILRLALNGVWPSSIMAVTFTNKAANEMRNRVKELFYESQIRFNNSVFVCTFHSACAKILRNYCDSLGFTKDFSILNDSDSKSIIKSVLENFCIEKNNPLTANILKSYFDKLKNIGITRNLNLLNIDPFETIRKFGEIHDTSLILNCFEEYQKILKQNNSMDFNDLILNTLILLNQNENVLFQLKRQFKYFLVDEFQDTNTVQYELICKLAGPENNIFVVGDDDQSIYSWRGADSSFILNFQRKFSKSKIYKLEENYRSSGFIIKSASEIITNNVNRAPKKIWTNNPNGNKINLMTFSDPYQESKFIAETIKSKNKNKPFSDFAVLFRTNAQSRILEDSFRKQFIPYVLIGSLKFYERFEIRVLINYLTSIINPQDDLNFEKTLLTPKKGLGSKSISRIKEIAVSQKKSMFSICCEIIHNQVPGHKLTLKALPLLKRHIEFLLLCQSNLHKSVQLSNILSLIVNHLNFEKYLIENYPEDADERILNTIELRNALDNFSEQYNDDFTPQIPHTASNKLALFLEQVQLTIDPAGNSNDEGCLDAVSLLTMHSAKGLEFNTVFLSGLEEGTLPHYNSSDDPKSIEEERRLLYVGMTRAKEMLFILNVSMNRFRPLIPAAPSRFLDEIPMDYVHQTIFNKPYFNSLKQMDKVDPFDKKDQLYIPHSKFNLGDKVWHKIFGEGTVKKIEATKKGYNIDVFFNIYGLKKLLDSYLDSKR